MRALKGHLELGHGCVRVVTEVLHEYFAEGVADVARHLAQETIRILEVLNLNADVSEKSCDGDPVFKKQRQQGSSSEGMQQCKRLTSKNSRTSCTWPEREARREANAAATFATTFHWDAAPGPGCA
jgi:hypothetical protein